MGAGRDIAMAIWEWPQHLEMVCETVEQLSALAPDPDEENEAEDQDKDEDEDEELR